MEFTGQSRVAAIEKLRTIPLEYGWQINDLLRFPDRTRFFAVGEPLHSDFSSLHVSGHPASLTIPTIILRGELGGVMRLLSQHAPQGRMTIRETPWHLAELVQETYPAAAVFRQMQMTTDSRSFRRVDTQSARILTQLDIDELARFTETATHGRDRLVNWIGGATVVGSFVNDELVSLGSTMFSIPELAVLVAIKTRPEYRRMGHGSQVTSMLTETSLRHSAQVSLTVRLDNEAALGVYRRLGYSSGEERFWASVGHNSTP
jgi:ribosomal protein S18 acetylase RimI-like enzyme